jgi:hypothetical protein
MKQYPYVQADIFENTLYPVVRHQFFGKTMTEARSYFQAHMVTDSFLHDAIKTGYYQDIKVQVKIIEIQGD